MTNDNLNDYPCLTEASLAVIAEHMLDEVREDVHSALAPCEPGVFLTAYMQRDPTFPVYQFGTGGAV